MTGREIYSVLAKIYHLYTGEKKTTLYYNTMIEEKKERKKETDMLKRIWDYKDSYTVDLMSTVDKWMSWFTCLHKNIDQCKRYEM